MRPAPILRGRMPWVRVRLRISSLLVLVLLTGLACGIANRLAARTKQQRDAVDTSRTRLTDEGMRGLTSLTRLEKLRLDGDEITDSGLVYLSRLRRLRVHGLSRTQVSDHGAVNLRDLSYLESIDMLFTNVSEFGAQDLRRAHPKARVLFVPTRL